MDKIYLSRRNLLALLEKLDHVRSGGQSACSIVKSDTTHPTCPQTIPNVIITAVEDDNYYTDREPGWMLDLSTNELK